jgi:hypothetical protein
MQRYIFVIGRGCKENYFYALSTLSGTGFKANFEL